MSDQVLHLLPNRFKSNINVLLLLIPGVIFAVVLTFLISYLPHTTAGIASQEILSNVGGQ